MTPFHRVVMTDGSIGSQSKPDIRRKVGLLKDEGIITQNGRILNFNEILFTDFISSQPLKLLREEQERIGESIGFDNTTDREFRMILGLDISYRGMEAQGAGVIMDRGEVVHEIVIRQKVGFPYISTYLSYRELPVYLKIMHKLQREDIQTDLIMVDGNGILHPRRCGIGAHLHILTGLPVVGIAKSRLCGDVGEFKPLRNIINDLDQRNHPDHARAAEMRFEGESRGYAYIHNSRKVKKPIFISPGGGISFRDALKIVVRHSRFRLPEPIRKAHELASAWR